MSYRVCIPTAGTGSRLLERTKYLNKSLVSIGYQPALARIINAFPADAEFVIPLGYKGDLVREFLTLAYPKRVFHFAEVSPFEGAGSGLGLSLLCCEAFLQCPFVFISCDTLVDEEIPDPSSNWMGWAERPDINSYRTIKLAECNTVSAVEDKGIGVLPASKPYIGLAGIHDYGAFWSGMHSGGMAVVEQGESYGLAEMLKRDLSITARQFTWYDTGSIAGLDAADAALKKENGPHILPKTNEAIWFVQGNVIKYSDDQTFIEQRVSRSRQLSGFIPEVTGSTPHMYCYKEVNGEVLSRVADLNLFSHLLEHCKTFWQKVQLSDNDFAEFRQGCMRFYKDKTLERVQKFYDTFQYTDAAELTNGIAMPRLSEMFESIDWEWLVDGLPGRFHGDFHFENILWNKEHEAFVFLDWRQNFAGSLAIGDIYYDFAKLWHGLIVSHAVIGSNLFSAKWENSTLRFDMMRPQSLVMYERYFINWLSKNGYDVSKARMLTALIYLNIAALHHYPYCVFLYGLGKSMLYEELEGMKDD